MENRKLIASDGMMLTDSVHFGKVVYLGEGADASDWREISEEEYFAMLGEADVL